MHEMNDHPVRLRLPPLHRLRCTHKSVPTSLPTFSPPWPPILGEFKFDVRAKAPPE
jgi:hypothetical protein